MVDKIKIIIDSEECGWMDGPQAPDEDIEIGGDCE